MTGAQSAAPARQPLRRAAGDRLLLGVCAGLARTIDVSPLAVRLAAVALAAIAAPLVLAAYVVAGAIVPRDDGRALLGGVPADRRETLLGWTLVAIVLTAFAAAEFRLEELVWPRLSSFGIFAAAAAALALIAASQRRAAVAAATPHTPPPPPTPAPASGSPAADARDGDEPDGDASDGDEPDGDASDGDEPDGDEPDGDEPAEAPTAVFPAGAAPPTATQPLPPPPPRGVSAGVIAAAVLLIGGALAFLLDAVGAIDPSATEVAGALAVAAALAGAGAIAAAVMRRRGVLWLLALGTILGASAAGVALLSTELDDGVGFRTVRPVTASEIPHTYRLGAGELDVDLRETDLPAGVTTVRARIGVGRLTVLVPRGVRAESVGPTFVDGVRFVNDALPERPARKRGTGKARRQRAAEPRPTIRIDADIREGEADVVRGGP